MTKIAYNACYGGFSLSKEAILRARVLSGNKWWGDVRLKDEAYSDGSVCNFDYGGHHIHNVERHDPVLIQVIEELGEKAASGRLAQIALVDLLPGTKYRIDEYDGIESVMSPDDYGWTIVP